MKLPSSVQIVEVGPRDGLQNQAKILPAAVKIDFIDRLSATGLSVIEATAFVSPKWIPQLADHAEVFAGIHKKSGVRYPVLVPNVKGMQVAMAAGVTDIAVFSAASETFSQKNTNCSIAESLARIAEIMILAKQHNIRVRGYISCVVGCPFEGAIAPGVVAPLVEKLLDLGCHEISLGDTIGVGTPKTVRVLLDAICKKIPVEKLAVHFHDTYGQALVNIYVALEHGIRVIDSSVAGLGGCPYAPGASGNVATEDVLYLLQGLGIETGVDLKKLVEAGRFVCEQLGQQVASKVSLALGG